MGTFLVSSCQIHFVKPQARVTVICMVVLSTRQAVSSCGHAICETAPRVPRTQSRNGTTPAENVIAKRHHSYRARNLQSGATPSALLPVHEMLPLFTMGSREFYIALNDLMRS